MERDVALYSSLITFETICVQINKSDTSSLVKSANRCVTLLVDTKTSLKSVKESNYFKSAI